MGVGAGILRMTQKDRPSLAGYEVSLLAMSALPRCSSIIRPGRNCMHFQQLMSAVIVCALLLLTGCAEKVPETSMDGIYTAAQADRGAGLFESLCARCHSVQEFSGRSFDAIWAGVPAAALYVRIANTMPLDQPGSLGIPQVTALMAHIFNENEMPAGDLPLEGDMEWLMTISLARPAH